MFPFSDLSNPDKFNLEEFSGVCLREMAEKNQHNIEDWGLGSYERWDIDQSTGKLTFSNGPENGGVRVTCDFQIAGTYSNVSHSWLWAWDNEHIDPGFASASRSIREMGKVHAIASFLESFDTNHDPGWEFTAIAGKLSNAEGCYRGPINENAGFMYLVFSNCIRSGAV